MIHCRHGQGRNLKAVLPGETQNCPTGSQHREVRAGGEQVGDERSGIKHLFEIIQDKQHAPGLEVGHQEFPDGP